MGGFALVLSLIIGIILLFGTILVGVCVYIATASRKRLKAIAGAEVCTIGDLAEGYWKVTGRLVALEAPIRSPMSGSDCVFYSFRVQELRTRQVSAYGTGPRGMGTGTRSESHWVTVIDDQDAIKCAVEDRTGRARLELRDAETILKSAHTSSGTFNDCPRDLQRRLSRRYGFDTKGLLFNKSLRYEETTLQDGDRVFVVGDVEVGRSGKPLFVKGQQPLIVSDRSETKVVGHYEVRAKWATIAAVLVGVLTLLVVGVLLAVLIGRMAVPKAPGAGPADPGAPPDVPRLPPEHKPTESGPATFEPVTKKEPGLPREETVKHETEPGARSHYYKQNILVEPPPILVPWTAAADPAPPGIGKPANPRGGIPLGFLHRRVVFPGQQSPFVAVYPKLGVGQPEPEGLIQVYDLRNFRPTSPTFLARTELGEPLVLSPDGAFVAGRVSGAGADHLIEVIETATGRPTRRLTAGQGKEYAIPVEFVGPARLLTTTQEHKFPDYGDKTEYKVWDVRTGAILSEFTFNATYFRRFTGISPGGRYITFQQSQTRLGYRLVTFDLTTGQVAGDVQMMPRSEPFGVNQAIAYSPDGKEFALFWVPQKKPGEKRADPWVRILIYDAATGKKIDELHPKPDLVRLPDALCLVEGPLALQWGPDRSSLLLFGHLLLDRKTGAVKARIGPEPKNGFEIPPRRFAGRDAITTTVGQVDNVALTFVPIPNSPASP